MIDICDEIITPFELTKYFGLTNLQSSYRTKTKYLIEVKMSVIMKVKTHPIEKLPAPLSEPIKKTASELAAEVKSPMVVVAFRNHHSAVKNRLIVLRRALSDNQINQSQQPTSTKVWPEQDFVVCPETRESERFSSPEKNEHN